MISKKKISEIKFVEVYSKVIRDYCWYKEKEGNKMCFLDAPMEEWTNEDKLIFDIASETENKIKEEILKLLTKGK